MPSAILTYTIIFPTRVNSTGVLQDLDTYAAQYTGFTKTQRLQFLAAVCPSVNVEALT
jgi:hypothetical protein